VREDERAADEAVGDDAFLEGDADSLAKPSAALRPESGIGIT
jgi:hypothetical protein